MSKYLSSPQKARGEESGITVLLTLGIAAPYFQREILQDLTVSDYINLRLTNKRHNNIVKDLGFLVRPKCNDTRLDIDGCAQCRRADTTTTLHNYWKWALLPEKQARRAAEGVLGHGRKCHVSWPGYKKQMRYCIGLPARLKGQELMGPCSGVVCRLCVVSSSCFMRESLKNLQRVRLGMLMCQTCQSHEASRYPYGFRSCTCDPVIERSWPFRDDNPWRCLRCLLTIVYRLTKIAVEKEYSLECVRKDDEGRILLDKPYPLNSVHVSDAPCPCCLDVIPQAWRRQNDQEGERQGQQFPTVQYCLACDGIIVSATHGADWRPTALAPSLPLTSSKEEVELHAKKLPPIYAIRDPDMIFTRVKNKKVIRKLKLKRL